MGSLSHLQVPHRRRRGLGAECQRGPRGVAWTTHGQNPCDFRPGPGCYGGSGYQASSRTDVPLGRCPRHTPFGRCWRFGVFFLSTSTLWAKAGVPVLRLRSSVSRGCGVGSWFSRMGDAVRGKTGERSCRRPTKPLRRWRPFTFAHAVVRAESGRFATWSRRGPRRRRVAGQLGAFETRAHFAKAHIAELSISSWFCKYLRRRSFDGRTS